MTALRDAGALLVLGAALAGCGSDAESGADGGSTGNYGGSTSSDGGPPLIGTGGSGGLPPEQEIDDAYRAPVVTGRYVWSANPESGRVAVIDPETLVVRLAEAGFRPSELAALPADGDADRAIVINEGSEDVTVLLADDVDVVATTTLPVHAGANAWAISPSGRWAIAWSDAALLDNPDPAESFQDLTVVDLSAGAERSFELSVGYRPSRIVFRNDEQAAFVVTEPGLSRIDLEATPSVGALIELSADPVDDPASRDVSILPDGSLALVRRDGNSAVGVVDLATAAITDLDLGAAITDLDLAADGERAFAVAGDELVVVPVPPSGDASAFPRAPFAGEVLRSVSPSAAGDFAVLYTNAVSNSHVGTVLAAADWSSTTTRVVDVKAPVSAALTSPSGAHALVLGTTPLGSSKAGVFAIVPAQMDRAVKVVGTDAPPAFVTFTPDSESAVLAVRDDARRVFGAYLIDLSNLAEDFVPLASAPLSAGVIPERNRAFVAQLHPEGRITFFDLLSGEAHTLTGFELSAKVQGQ